MVTTGSVTEGDDDRKDTIVSVYRDLHSLFLGSSYSAFILLPKYDIFLFLSNTLDSYLSLSWRLELYPIESSSKYSSFLYSIVLDIVIKLTK